MSERQRSVSEDDLARLKREREDADQRYNAALTALDAAIQALPDFPHPPPGSDETQVTPLNTRWNILAAAPAFPAGWRGRVATFVWNLVEPALASQQAFNSALVDHINRNVAAQREMPRSIDSTIALLRQQTEQLVHFQSRLVVYLQQLTPYVDTKDYEFAGLGRRVVEDAQEEIERLDRTTRGLAAGISGVSDEMLKRWESLLARDQRYSGRIDELRTVLAVVQQQFTALKREFGRAPAGLRSRPPDDTGGRDFSPAATDSWKYVGFEDLYRGSRDEIRARL